MRAGRLDRVITVQRSVDAPGDYGETFLAWSNVATLRAGLVQASTTEYMAAYGAAPEEAVIFRTRFLDGITTDDRVVYEGRTHDIKELKEIGRRRGLEIRTVARAAQ